MPSYYNIKQELEEMKHLSKEQKEKLKTAIELLSAVNNEIDYNFREHACINTSLELLEKAYKF